MAPLQKKTVEHFTHPGHALLLLTDGDSEYSCSGCKIPGFGKRYRCHLCSYDMHEFCATCPQNFCSFMHPHPLTLVTRKAKSTRSNERVCDLCKDHVEGLFYRCKVCDFDVHPLCTQLPETLRHVLHEIHPLRLQTFSTPGCCAVCGGLCGSWRYRCRVCGFDIHLQCVLIQCKKTTSTSERGIPKYVPPATARSVHQTPPAGPWSPPPSGGFAYGFEHCPSPGPYPFFPGQPGMFYNNHYPIANSVPSHTNSGGGGGNLVVASLSRMMFQLVGQIGAGVITNIIFGI